MDVLSMPLFFLASSSLKLTFIANESRFGDFLCFFTAFFPSDFLQINLSKMVHEGLSDPIVTRIVEEDHVKWYKKANLRRMYVCLFLCCMGVEMTSGFDSTLIGTLQFSPPWNACMLLPHLPLHPSLTLCRLQRWYQGQQRGTHAVSRTPGFRLVMLPTRFYHRCANRSMV